MYRLLTLCFLSVACLQYTYASDITDEVSEGGIEYSLVSMPGNSRISVQIAWPTDWAFEKNNNQAVPHLASQLLLAGGAEGYSPGEVIDRFQDMQSEGYLSTNTEYLMGTIHYSPQHEDETLAIVNAHLRQPSMDERWLERIRAQFIEQRDSTALSVRGFDVLRWAVFKDDPLAAALMLQEPGMLEAVTREDTVAWIESVIARAGITVTIAGDLDAKAAGNVIDTIFKGVPEGQAITRRTASADYSARRILIHTPDAQVSTLSFIGELPPAGDGSELEDIVLISELGQGPNSVLFEAVRTGLRASYGYNAMISAFTQSRRFIYLNGQIETEKLAEAEATVRKAYAEFLDNGPSIDLKQLKSPIQSNLDSALEDTGSLSYSLILAKLNGESPTDSSFIMSELQSVTDQSRAQRLKSAFPTPDELIMVISSPDADAIEDACVITEPVQAVDC